MTVSEKLFEKAKHYIPGGVNSPVRSFNAIGDITPPFLLKGEGAYVYDVDGNAYIDYVGSWGPLILGHKHPATISAIKDALDHGISFGAPCPLEVELAELICEQLDSIDQVRMMNSGTEATMTAIRLARGYTERDLLIKFEGCYHGHSDSLLVKAGSGLLTFNQPSSKGVPADIAKHTLNLPYNDIQALEDAFADLGDKVAGVILEPIAGNMNLIPAKLAFLQTVRRLCDEYGAIFIMDEVMTGFRVHRQSAQGLYGIRPDLTTLGKVIGGGMPVGALGGRKDIMACLAPLGGVYQAGTLSGNPITMAAGLATLTAIQQQADFYEQLAQKTESFTEQMTACARRAGIPLLIQQVPGMFGLFFTEKAEITCFDEVKGCDTNRFKAFFKGMLQAGVYLAPSPFEAGFISIAHTEQDLQKTVACAERVFKTL